MIILYVGVLNDDSIKSVGGKYRLEYYTFSTEWSDKKHIIEGDYKTLAKWYKKHFRDRVAEQGRAWGKEDGEELDEENAIKYWDDMVGLGDMIGLE